MKKVLVIRFSSIGDIVLTSPVIRCLKQQLPDVKVHFLTKQQYLPVIEANPYIDKIWLYNQNFRELIPQLKSEGFDFIVDLHKNYRSLFVRLSIGVRSASFQKLNIRKWMIVNLKINFLPSVHVVDRYFMAVEQLNVKNDGQGLDYFIPEKSEVDIKTLPEIYRQGYIAMVIGGKHKTKIFPTEKLAELGKKISRPVILLGGREDQERGEHIVTSDRSILFNACGKYTLNQSASLLRQAEAVISNDTGLMHIAAAFRKRMVSVRGNTIPAFGMYPYFPEAWQGNSFIAEVKGLPCRPCSKLGYQTCPKKHFRCMMEIDHKPIIDFLMRETGTSTIKNLKSCLPSGGH